ncbi:MAG: hypothetical protein ACRBF0_13935 [Calditrichia bacterium]
MPNKKENKPENPSYYSAIGIGLHLSDLDVKFWVEHSMQNPETLPEAERGRLKQMRAHVEKCPRCASRTSISDNMISGNKKSYDTRVLLRNGMLLFTLIFCVWRFGIPPASNELIALAEKYKAEDIATKDKSLFAYAESEGITILNSSFKDYAMLDKLVNATTRSSILTNPQKYIPKDLSLQFEKEITFTWPPFDEPVELVVKDNQNQKLIQSPVAVGISEVTISVEQGSGLYYWGIRNNENLLLQRRIYIISD